MQVRTFQSIDMKKALSQVREEMGPGAVILNTRKIRKGNSAFGLFSRPLIEVTAAVDESDPDAYQRNRNGRRKLPQPETARKTVPKKTGRPDVTLEQFASTLDPLRDEIQNLKELIGASLNGGALASLELKKAIGMADDLEETKTLINLMVEQSDSFRGLGLDTNYLVCYRRMLDRGMEPEHALKLVRKVRDNVPGKREIELKEVVAQLVELIKESMFTGEPIIPLDDGPRVVALVGPTGVGKTTTIAKIAAGLALQNKKVALITIDTFRIAAVEQLKTYAGILEIPIEVVVSPKELRKAIKSFASKDVILIDTAGRSQRDLKKLDELATFLGTTDLIENYLVLSASADPKTVDEAVRNFACVNPAGLIFTKLDETVKTGIVISQNFKTGLPVVYTTNGQMVPEDIEPASPAKLATGLFKKEA